MTRSMYLLLVLLLQGLLQSLATTQCGSDQTGLFQSNPKVLKGALEQEASGTCTDTRFDSGLVTDTSECASPSGKVLIPTNPAGFPHPGSLTCGELACQINILDLDIFIPDGEVFDPETDYYEFQNASNYLVCQGPSACTGLPARGLAAACCNADGACSSSSLQLHSGDVCCNTACSDATITGARNVVCGPGCISAKITLAGDLVIRGSGALSARFTFRENERHCIQVLGTGFNALSAKFTFEQSTNVSMKCNGGTNGCFAVDVTLSKGSCFHVDCGSSGLNCDSFEVLPLVAGETDFKCYCTGTNCAWANSPAHPYCETTTDPNPCGAGICPGTLPACMQDAATVDCARLATTTTTSRAVAADPGAGVQGDPHLRTLDGKHYTLLTQGNFLLWGFSGETRISVGQSGEKMPAEFEILAHYAGQASFTKGLLFVDKSTMPHQALEVTTEDCLWHHRDAKNAGASGPSWRPIQSPQMNIGAFNLSTSLSSKQRKLEIVLKHEGMRKLAQLWVSCRPGKQISAKLRMASPKDFRFVRGELSPGRLSLAEGGNGHEASQMASDPEYALTSDWGDLGGSTSAASYFKLVDETGSESAVFTSCTEAVKEKFAKTCRKHLGNSAGDFYEQVLQDCVFDLCQGAGETSAELAAEIYNS